MMLVLNRLRGTNGIWSKFNGLLIAYILLSVFNNHYLALSVGILYVIGESFGWGDWVGAVSERNYLSMPQPYNEGKNNGIQWLASKIIDPSKNWLNHCRLALLIRGLYWWVCLLPLVFFIEWCFVLLTIALLSLAFPLACEIGYHTYKLWNFKYMTGGWEHSEVFYGLFQDLILIFLLIVGIYHGV